MHCPWVRKTRAWGYEVIRGIDEDDPLRVIRAFRYPTGLAFVDLNAQVEIDYGGYAWTQWMHGHFGDTALHIALKWKRHRAVKALLSLRPDWTVRNEAGVTAEQLVLRMYGKGMYQFKDEQEREYENDAMRAEEEATRSLMAAEQAARERDRRRFLEDLHAARTLGVEREAAILLEHGRIILPQEVVVLDRSRGGVHDSATVHKKGGGGSSSSQGRWVSHVCRELRRNRFAAQRGAMRRNVVPALPPRLATAAVGGEATGAGEGASSFSPPPTTAGSIHSRAGTTRSKTKPRKYLRSPSSARSGRISGGRRKRRAREPDAAQSDAGGGDGKKDDRAGEEEEEKEDDGGDLFFDSSSAVGSGRWPCADDLGRARPVSPLRSASPLRGSRAGAPSMSRRGRNAASSAAGGDGGGSVRSGSIWSGGGKAATSPGRFDRSSRMSAMRTTQILAAGKTLRRPTPEDRLQRKMAARSAARAHPTRSAPATAEPTPSPPALAGLPRPPILPVPLVVLRQTARSSANGGGRVASASGGGSSTTVDGDGACGGGRQESSAATVQARGSAVEDRSGASSRAASGSKGNDGGADVTTRQAPGGGGATVADSSTEARRSRSPRNTNATSDQGKNGGRGNSARGGGPSAAPGSARKAPDTPKLNGRGNGKDAAHSYGGVTDINGGGEDLPPSPQARQVPVHGDDDSSSSPRPLSQPTGRAGSDGGVQDTLRGVREGAMRDVLAALLTSTVMAEDGGRVLVPSFPSVSALRELKYCGPVESPQASALGRVLFARRGVLVRLSLPGKRIGDGGAAAIAPALPGIRSVDLRSNNIGDDGAVAISSALQTAAASAATAVASKRAASRGDEGGGNAKCPCILENLSLAGNRIGDVGAAALGELLEEEEEEGEEREGNKRRLGQGEEGELTSQARSPDRLRYLGWLSVAGNPGISSDGKDRLLRAGSNRRRLRGGSCRGDENNPPSMVVVIV